MFPIDQSTLDDDQRQLAKFATVVGDGAVTPLGRLLPAVRKVGEDGGNGPNPAVSSTRGWMSVPEIV